VDGEDELLDPGRPTMSRPVRIAGAVLLVAALIAVFAIRLWPGSSPKPQPAALGTPPPAGPSIVSDTPAAPQRQWPTAPSACGGTTELPLVSGTRPVAEHTGLALLTGGRKLYTVDFDTGRVSALSTTGSSRRRFVQTLTAVLPAFGTTASCHGGAASGLIRIDTDHHVADLGPLHPDQSVLADGRHAWIVTSPNSRKVAATLRPVAGGPVVTLPKQTYPAEIENGTIVASRQGDGHHAVVLLDATTGRVERQLPDADYPLAAGADLVLWTSGCDPTGDGPCPLDVLRSTNGRVTHVRLPRPALAATISPDGSQVALLMESAGTNLYAGHPFPPSNIAVLNLHTGRLQIIPGITIGAKEFPGLAFSPDGRWLAISLDAGTKTRLLAWRPGLGPPYEGVSVPGRTDGAPPLLVLGG
jgi:DNA-binding beta-propeller fold protein YncE